MVAAAIAACDLCGLPAHQPIYGENREIFCCPACREVHALLQIEKSAPAAAETTDTALAQETFSLGGMWCASCAWLITETLKRTSGVATAEVSFARRQARVSFDPARVAMKKLILRIRGLGYRAWPADQPAPYDEEESLANRLLFGGMFAMQVMMMSLAIYARDWLFPSPETEYLVRYFNWVNLIGTIPLIPLFAFPILRAGLASLMSRRPNMHALISIGTLAAFILSIRNLLAGAEHVYFDTVSMLLFLVALGRWLEVRAQKTGGDAVERLWKKMPHEATWLSPTGERRIPVDELSHGARVWVRPGERFPVDGLVATGEGDVDESLLTGEPMPILRRSGERVMAGTINVDGSFEVITTAIGPETTAGQIGKLLHQAMWERAPVQQLADTIAAWMVPVAVTLAMLTFGFWTWQAGVETGLLNALSVLLIACPCALGLATPLTLWSAIGRAAESGVILRSGSALERLSAIQNVFFDKTGTLTERHFQVKDIYPANGLSPDEILARVAAAERPSEHPLGQAIVVAAQQRRLAVPDVADFRALPGQGVTGRVKGLEIWIGSQHLIRANGIYMPPRLVKQAVALQRDGMCVVFAAWGNQARALIGLTEQPRPKAVETMKDLKDMSLDVTILTGDDSAAGARWQDFAGVRTLAELLPQDKIEQLNAATGPSAMIGDGINDGPALASADVGIALSQGTDVAHAAAEVILLNSDLRAVPWLIGLGRMTLRRVRQNLAWAFVYNVIGLGLAVSGILLPVLSALAMVLSSVMVTGNALRLSSYPLLNDVGGDQ